jgi:hypothetical protein
MHHTIGALSAFIIGIAGGDNVTLQHLDHLIVWEEPAEKQESLTVKPTPKIRYQIGKPYLINTPSATATPSAKGYAESADKNLISDIIIADEDTAGCSIDKVTAVCADSNSGLSQADIDKRVKELMRDNSTLYFSSDNVPLTDNPLKDFNRLTTVYFFINSPTTAYKINTDKLNPSKPVFLLGFASPDGEAPRLQTDLAAARAEHIKAKLEELGYKTAISGVALCNRCWQVEIYQ